MRYNPISSNFQMSAVEVNQHREGVCRELAHLGIALCRSLCIPARIVVGYLNGLEPMDFHAWFEAFVGGRWYTFDATQDAPRGGRLPSVMGVMRPMWRYSTNLARRYIQELWKRGSRSWTLPRVADENPAPKRCASCLVGFIEGYYPSIAAIESWQPRISPRHESSVPRPANPSATHPPQVAQLALAVGPFLCRWRI